MKSLKDYSLNITEKEYHAHPAWSHSKISRYATEGFKAIATLHEPTKPTPSMEFGSLVDCLVTKGNFDDEYLIVDAVPYPSEKSVLDWLLEHTSVPFYDIPTPLMQDAIAACAYRLNLKYETQYSKIEAVRKYYDDRRTGRKVISQSEYDDAYALAAAVKEYPTSGELFGEPGLHDDIEYIYQAKFKAKMKVGDRKVDIRIMPDLLVVNHTLKTIRPVDLKTSSDPAFDFFHNFIKYRYDIQASEYTDVLQVIINSIVEYNNYTILPFVFVDISRSDRIPVCWEYDPRSEDQKDGLHFKNYQYKDWRTLLGEILDYEESNAVVPSYIDLNGYNDLVSILNNN